MIRMKAVDVLQPDILYIGGITRTLRAAVMAGEAMLKCVPHSANLSLVTLFTLHLMGAIPNAWTFVEFSIENTPWTDKLFSPALEVKEGKVMIPSEPGWGATINPEWLAKAQKQVSK